MSHDFFSKDHGECGWSEIPNDPPLPTHEVLVENLGERNVNGSDIVVLRSASAGFLMLDESGASKMLSLNLKAETVDGVPRPIDLCLGSESVAMDLMVQLMALLLSRDEMARIGTEIADSVLMRRITGEKTDMESTFPDTV